MKKQGYTAGLRAKGFRREEGGSGGYDGGD
jgi:hypothetical protein